MSFAAMADAEPMCARYNSMVGVEKVWRHPNPGDCRALEVRCDGRRGDPVRAYPRQRVGARPPRRKRRRLRRGHCVTVIESQSFRQGGRLLHAWSTRKMRARARVYICVTMCLCRCGCGVWRVVRARFGCERESDVCVAKRFRRRAAVAVVPVVAVGGGGGGTAENDVDMGISGG